MNYPISTLTTDNGNMNWKMLGDSALILTAPDEPTAIRWSRAMRSAQPTWLDDLVPAYVTVGLFFDLMCIGPDEVVDWASRNIESAAAQETIASRRHCIPVCYERNLDLTKVAEATQMSPDQVIIAHVQSSYTVYAIGFVPGFPYLGYLPESLRGVGRLPSPRVRVEPGSVGMTGKQTGIYPLPRPGGWNIIGQTPRIIVDILDGFFPLRVGDEVTFVRIDEAEFQRQLGERLPILPG
jgi:inhibitor of KinA